MADIERYVQSGGGKIAPGTAPKAGDSGNPFTAWMTVLHRVDDIVIHGVDDGHSLREWNTVPLKDGDFAPWQAQAGRHPRVASVEQCDEHTLVQPSISTRRPRAAGR